jgi:type II secretory pathway pseudopilin PulG
MSRRSASGYTLLDVVVMLIFCLVFLAVVSPSVSERSGRVANRVKCSNNMRQIGLAIYMYEREYGGAFPRTRWDADILQPVAFTSADAPHPFAEDGPGPNDVTAALFLLLRTFDLSSDVFICPTTPYRAWPGDAMSAANFPNEQYLSYSVHNPYSNTVEADAEGRRNEAFGQDFPILADMNPGTDDVLTVTPTSPQQPQRAANSYNHLRDGQNVMYADAHVEWHPTVFAGRNRPAGNTSPRDNLFKASTAEENSAGGGAIYAPPTDADDAILLPAATMDPGSFDAAMTPWAIGRLVAVAALAIAVIVMLVRMFRQRPPHQEQQA